MDAVISFWLPLAGALGVLVIGLGAIDVISRRKSNELYRQLRARDQARLRVSTSNVGAAE